jgi:hypothetical protein
MLIGAEPERLHGRHPELAGAAHVLVQPVADEDGVRGGDVKRLQRPLEDGRVGLPLSDLGREDREVEPLGQPQLLEVTVEKPARIERVRDEPELEPALAQRLQQGGSVGGELPRRVPRRVLGLEKPRQLLVVDLDSEIPEQLPDKARVLELLDRAGGPEERLVSLAKMRRQGFHLRQVVAPERCEPGAMAGLDERHVVGEAHQGVAPVEEDRRRHAVRVSAWRERSFGRPSRSCRSPSSSISPSIRATFRCSSCRPRR